MRLLLRLVFPCTARLPPASSRLLPTLPPQGSLPPTRSLPLLPAHPLPPGLPKAPAAAAAGPPRRQRSDQQGATKRSKKAAAGAFDAPHLRLEPKPDDALSKKRPIIDVKLEITWAELQAVREDAIFASFRSDLTKAVDAALGRDAPAGGGGGGGGQQPQDPDAVKPGCVFSLTRRCTGPELRTVKQDAEVQRLLPLLRTAAANVLKSRGGSSYKPRRGAKSPPAE